MASLGWQGIQRRVPADAEQVPCLRHVISGFADEHCQQSAETRAAVELAVTEACANVVRHAYPKARGELRLAARIDDQVLIVEIADDGIGLNGNSQNKGLGVGLHIIRDLAETHITSDSRGTLVQLRFPPRDGGC
jgi:serine/threonine-protein kinase RsbW